MAKVIAILIGFFPNPRFYKRIELEKQLGELHVICWDKKNGMYLPPKEEGYYIHVIECAAASDPVKRIIPYRKFSKQARDLLSSLSPDVIHVQGIDMLKIAATYKERYNNKVSIIYEVADLHRLLVDRQTHPIKRAIQFYLRKEDKKYVKDYENLIITSQKFNEVYFKSFVPQNKIVYMPNVPDLTAFRNYRKKTDQSGFTVGYIGSVRYKQQMKNLIEAAERCNMHLLIAGFENEPIEIEPLCINKPNIDWIGRFDFNERAAELYGRCDVMYSVYDADAENVKVALPNKLYESVYCEMPIIVAKNTYLAQIVEEWGVGVSVNHKSIDELAEVLNQLRDDRSLIDSIRENCCCRKEDVDLRKYNEILKKKLIQLLS